MSKDEPQARWVISTVADVAQARKLAHALLERRLVACVNIAPGATSLYRWQGRIEEASEVLLFAKTVASRVDELERAWRELHAYEVPEFLVLEPAHVEARYLRWLRDETAPVP